MTTTILNTDIQEYGIDPLEIPFIVICEDHGEWRDAINQEEAKDLEELPETWCKDCWGEYR